MLFVHVMLAIVAIPIFLAAELLGFLVGFTADAFMIGWARTDFETWRKKVRRP